MLARHAPRDLQQYCMASSCTDCRVRTYSAIATRANATLASSAKKSHMRASSFSCGVASCQPHPHQLTAQASCNSPASPAPTHASLHTQTTTSVFNAGLNVPTSVAGSWQSARSPLPKRMCFRHVACVTRSHATIPFSLATSTTRRQTPGPIASGPCTHPPKPPAPVAAAAVLAAQPQLAASTRAPLPMAICRP